MPMRPTPRAGGTFSQTCALLELSRALLRRYALQLSPLTTSISLLMLTKMIFRSGDGWLAPS